MAHKKCSSTAHVSRISPTQLVSLYGESRLDVMACESAVILGGSKDSV